MFLRSQPWNLIEQGRKLSFFVSRSDLKNSNDVNSISILCDHVVPEINARIDSGNHCDDEASRHIHGGRRRLCLIPVRYLQKPQRNMQPGMSFQPLPFSSAANWLRSVVNTFPRYLAAAASPIDIISNYWKVLGQTPNIYTNMLRGDC